MAEIREIPWNGFNVVSTFAGGGGSSLGYRMAGFRILWINEFVEAARDTYQANQAPHTQIDARDIRDITPAEILQAAGLAQGELDVLDGSPPCASFSTAGKKEAGWGKVRKYSDVEQVTDDLFFEYARLLEGLQPKVFVAENVSGLIKGKAKGYFLNILAALKACGYQVSARLLDAQWLGVPQTRQRVIFVGVRNDLGLQPAHPDPLGYRYSVRDALPEILSVPVLLSGKKPGRKEAGLPCPTIMTDRVGAVSAGQNYVEARRAIHDTRGKESFSMGDITDRPAPAVTAGGTGQLVIEADSDISRYAIGKEWDQLSVGEQSKKYFSLVKADPGKACPAITATAGISAGAAGVVHPTERRKFSISELKRICSFPDDFILTGSYAQQWERCGRAVPPVMMSHVASTIRDRILKCAG